MSENANDIKKEGAAPVPPPELDRNMISSAPDENGFVWYNVKEAPFRIYGLMSEPDADFCRLPRAVAEATNPGVTRNRVHTAGGRVRFSTDSRRVAIRVAMPYVTHFAHMALTGSASFDLYTDTEVGSKYWRVFRPEPNITDGFTASVAFKSDAYRYLTLNFPLYSPVSKLEIGLDAGARLGEGREYLPALPVVFYGSSITQGACASRPGLSYQAVISNRLNLDYVNLGFSGNARAELPIVEYMASLPMSIFVSDYDHNAPRVSYLADTHYRMYSVIREKNPHLPYIMVSRPDVDYDYEDTMRRRAVIEDSFRRAREAGDKNVYYIDGEGIYRGPEEDMCSVDGAHPNDIGFLKMADSIGRVIRRIMRNGLKTEGGTSL